MKALRIIERFPHEPGKVRDRTTWPPGEWDSEPDLIEWRDDATGYPCLIARGPRGSLCGYVGVPEGHPAHGKDCDSVDAPAHGGLTYSAGCAGHICHVPQPGEADGVWWLGFDCAHAGDEVPGSLAVRRKVAEELRAKYAGFSDYMPRDTYKNIAFVETEVTELAAALKGLA